MDVSIINRILNSFTDIMPQLGFTNIKIGEVVLRGKCIESPGVIVIIGIIGDIQGNIIYSMDGENAKKIASVMMMGSEIKEFDNINEITLLDTIEVPSVWQVNGYDYNQYTNVKYPDWLS